MSVNTFVNMHISMKVPADLSELQPIPTRRTKSGWVGVYPARKGRWQAQDAPGHEDCRCDSHSHCHGHDHGHSHSHRHSHDHGTACSHGHDYGHDHGERHAHTVRIPTLRLVSICSGASEPPLDRRLWERVGGGRHCCSACAFMHTRMHMHLARAHARADAPAQAYAHLRRRASPSQRT